VRCSPTTWKIAHSKDHAVGEDVVKCAIELIDKVDAMKNTDGTRVFRSVPQCTRVRIAWALIKLAHDLCFIYATVEDLFATCDMGTDVTVKSVNKMVDALRGPLHVQCYCPDEKGPCERPSTSDAGAGDPESRR
jgi:hypothetical protein